MNVPVDRKSTSPDCLVRPASPRSLARRCGATLPATTCGERVVLAGSFSSLTMVGERATNGVGRDDIQHTFDEANRFKPIQRVRRYFDAVESEDRALGPWGTGRVCKVLAYLERGYYGIGLKMMSEVELPDLHRTYKELAVVADAPF